MQSSAPVGGAMKAATISDLKIQFISRKGNCGECAKKCVNALPHISTTTTHGTSNNPLSIKAFNNNNNNSNSNSNKNYKNNNNNKLYPKLNLTSTIIVNQPSFIRKDIHTKTEEAEGG